MNRFLVVSVLSAAPLLALGSAVFADEGGIHECKDANGQLVYQDEPCLEAVPAPTKPVAKTTPKTQPKTSAKPARVAKSPKAPKPAIAQPPEVHPENWVVTPPPAARHVEPAPTGRSNDGRLATPEKTLQTFVEAVKAGDRTLVLSCLTSSALADLGPDPPELPMEKLRETVDSFTGYVAEGDLGPFWSIRAQRGAERPKWIFFERTGSGDWKIAAI